MLNTSKLIGKVSAVIFLFFLVKNVLYAGESIALVNISTPNRVSFSQYTLSSLIKYASKWGYFFYFYPTKIDASCNMFWNKIKVILDLLNEGKHDWYVWFDDDVFITNPNISIENIIKKYCEQAHFVIEGGNSGVLLIKNSDWSRNFFQEWYDQRHKYGTEEYALADILKTKKYKNSPNIAVISGRKIQSHLMLFFKKDPLPCSEWRPGDFAAHLAGACEGVRVSILEQFSVNPNIYPVLPDGLEEFTLTQTPNNTYFSDFEIYKLGAEKTLLSGKSAVSWQLAEDGFGSSLLAYLHAKWISYKYNIPLLYCPFKYSDQLVLSGAELCRTHFSANNIKILGRDTVKIDPDNVILYEVPKFPESLKEYEQGVHGCVYFNINWDDENFISTVRKFIAPTQQLTLLQVPDDKITVAVHLRKNSSDVDKILSFEGNEQKKIEIQSDDDKLPLKYLNDDFYIDSINKIYKFLNRKPLYVYIFTDYNNPKRIADKYQRALNNPAITIDYRHGVNDHDINVLEDFFSMLKFDCLIRCDSNFSFIASKLGNYKVVISPAGYTTRNGNTKIVHVNISTKIEDI